MANNKGKKFEQIVREAFEKVEGVSIDRIPDQTMRYKGAANICDFIVYKQPYEFYIECKTTHGNTLPFINIKDKQWDGLLEKSQIAGVYAGVICWWVDKDVTKFIPIETLARLKNSGYKSIKYNFYSLPVFDIVGDKKRVYMEYDMQAFLEEVTK